MKKYSRFLLLMICTLHFTGCSHDVQTTGSAEIAVSDSERSTTGDLKENGNKIQVDYQKQKALLDAILLLPDSAFASWDWKLADRRSWCNEIKSSGYYIDNDPNYFTQRVLKPNFAEFSIVDGVWSISLYKGEDNTSVVISKDVAGDGQDINIYEINGQQIKAISLPTMFGDYSKLVVNREGTQHCITEYEKIDHPLFEFRHSDLNKVEIDGSWYLKEDEYSACLKGNTLTYEFDPATKKFVLVNISWNARREE